MNNIIKEIVDIDYIIPLNKFNNIVNTDYTAIFNYTHDNTYATIYSNKYSNKNRLSNFNLGYFSNNYTELFNILIYDSLKWLNDKCWINKITHGDLTTDNIIINLDEKKIIIIDWFDTMTLNYNDNFKLIFHILLDSFDLFSSYLYGLGYDWRDLNQPKNNCYTDIFNIVYNENIYNIFELLQENIKNNESPDLSLNDYKNIINNIDIKIILTWFKQYNLLNFITFI